MNIVCLGDAHANLPALEAAVLRHLGRAADALSAADRALERDLALLLGIDHHQNVSVLDHVLLLGKKANDGNSLAITA